MKVWIRSYGGVCCVMSNDANSRQKERSFPSHALPRPLNRATSGFACARDALAKGYDAEEVRVGHVGCVLGASKQLDQPSPPQTEANMVTQSCNGALVIRAGHYYDIELVKHVLSLRCP